MIGEQARLGKNGLRNKLDVFKSVAAKEIHFRILEELTKAASSHQQLSVREHESRGMRNGEAQSTVPIFKQKGKNKRMT